MSFLELIWLASLWLAGTALLVMGGLIAARIVSARRTRTRDERRRMLVRELLGTEGRRLSHLTEVPADIVSATFADLLRLVRGDERGAFIEQARELGVPADLARSARRGSARDRLAATRALANFDDADSIAVLHAKLRDRDEDVRLAAALALAETGGAQEIRELVAAVSSGGADNAMMMVALFRMLAEQQPEAIKDLALSAGTDPTARIAAIDALSTTGDFTLVPAIARMAVFADDGAPELPRYLAALGTLGHPAAKPAVLRGLERKDPAARAEAAAAAGRIGMAEAIERLADLLDDAEWQVRFNAADALVKLRPRGAEALRRMARTGSGLARDAATTVLAENGLAA